MINLSDIAAYTLALGIAAAIPGPGITALVARSVGSGTRAGANAQKRLHRSAAVAMAGAAGTMILREW